MFTLPILLAGFNRVTFHLVKKNSLTFHSSEHNESIFLFKCWSNFFFYFFTNPTEQCWDISRCRTSKFTCFPDIEFSWLAQSVKYLTAVLIPVASISCEVFLFEFFSRRIRKPLACGSWFTNCSRVLPTSQVVYQPIIHRILWSIAFI